MQTHICLNRIHVWIGYIVWMGYIVRKGTCTQFSTRIWLFNGWKIFLEQGYRHEWSGHYANFSYKECLLNILFFPSFHYFGTSPSPSLCCYWLFRKWPANKSDCTLNQKSCSPAGREWVACSELEKNTKNMENLVFGFFMKNIVFHIQGAIANQWH